MVKTKDRFRFWFPVDKIQKSVDDEGNEVMIVGGIASTGRRDTDEEKMDTSGFELDYFEERGIINWNHGTKPEHVIGEPVKVSNTKKGLYVESMLYPDKPLAKQAYELAETLKKYSKKRRLGYSIEGKVLSRDPNDARTVKKAMITNMALTISPKNADSIVDIIKGNFHEIEDEPEYDVEKANSFETSVANGGQQLIIDITREDGTRVTVDKNLNISIVKALSTNSSSGKAVVKESLDNELKDLTKGNTLTWKECIDRVKSFNSVISLEKANKFVEILNNLAMSTKNGKTAITEDLLEKALANVGILPASKNKIKKSNDDEEEVEDEVEDDEPDTTTPKSKLKKTTSKVKDEEDEEDEEEEEPPVKIKKSNKANKLSKVTVVNDDNVELIKSVGVIAKACWDEVKALRQENDLIKSEFDELKEKLEETLDRPAHGRKSLAKPTQRNFKKSVSADEEEDDDVRVLSLSRDKQQILQLMDDSTFTKGHNGEEVMDQQMANQMSLFEIHNRINKSAINKLESKYNIQIVD